MKRLYCAALALLMAGSLAACGGQGESAPSATATPQPAEMAETTSTEETAAPAEETAALPAVAGELYPILPADDTHMWFNTGTRGFHKSFSLERFRPSVGKKMENVLPSPTVERTLM